MNKYNFNNVTINAENVIFTENPFSWVKANSFLGRKTAEYHYKCEKTGAFMCKEYKEGGGLKSVTYSMPNSEDYDIKTEEELIMKIFGIKQLNL